jgi:hypothetical protein
MLIKPGVRFEVGQIVKLVDFGEDIVADICDGDLAFGIAGNRCYVDSDSVVYDLKRMLKVWSQRMVFRTSMFDHQHKYEPGAGLYVDGVGVLTTGKAKEDSTCVARVISGPNGKRKYMEALWL